MAAQSQPPASSCLHWGAPPPTHTHAHTQIHSCTLPSLPCRALQVAEAWGAAASSSPFLTDVALQTQRLTLDIVGLVAFSHDFGQAQQAIRCMREGEEGAGASKTGALSWRGNRHMCAAVYVFEQVDACSRCSTADYTPLALGSAGTDRGGATRGLQRRTGCCGR